MIYTHPPPKIEQSKSIGRIARNSEITHNPNGAIATYLAMKWQSMMLHIKGAVGVKQEVMKHYVWYVFHAPLEVGYSLEWEQNMPLLSYNIHRNG